MLNKYTIIGLIVGGIITTLGIGSMIDSLANPNEIRQTNDTFGTGDSDRIRFNAPANSFQTMVITGDAFDVKIFASDEKNNVDSSYKDKATFSWTNTVSGENIIQIQNTGKSEFNISGTFELSRDPLFFTYHIMVIIAGIVVIGFSAAFTARKPRGF
ncbi:MAG: hypothetical protein VYC06_00530 [Thermoproteota archaeon]|nr:hypothetical protein [Thermoproteota archaeon]|tara:strand:- start:813 stop:1283 length:471 start_codon:yes stop_codon:yes gene_type:complete